MNILSPKQNFNLGKPQIKLLRPHPRGTGLSVVVRLGEGGGQSLALENPAYRILDSYKAKNPLKISGGMLGGWWCPNPL